MISAGSSQYSLALLLMAVHCKPPTATDFLNSSMRLDVAEGQTT